VQHLLCLTAKNTTKRRSDNMRQETEEMLFQKIRVKKTRSLSEREMRRLERKKKIRAKQKWRDHQLNYGQTS